MKTLWAVVMGLLLCASGWSQTYQNQVWGQGNVIYGQATLTDIRMATHQLTTKVRFVNTTTGVAGPWITKITSGSQPNVNRISQLRPNAPYQYAFEIEYKVFCPSGRYNSEESRSMFFSVGYTLNCLTKIVTSQQLNTHPDGSKWWYALYSLAPSCGGSCLVTGNIGFETPYAGHAAADYNVQMRYWWLKVFWGSTYCLDAYEAGRAPCTSANCGDFSR